PARGPRGVDGGTRGALARRAGQLRSLRGELARRPGPRPPLLQLGDANLRRARVAALAADPDAARYAGRVLSSAELARTYRVTDIDGTQPDCWRYLVEIQEAGRPPTELDYR